MYLGEVVLGGREYFVLPVVNSAKMTDLGGEKGCSKRTIWDGKAFVSILLYPV